MKQPAVAIVGAGVVGAASAYVLAKAGCHVTVYEVEAAAGLKASGANGAQLSYAYVEPLASPGTLRKLPSMLLDPASPLRFRLRADPAQWAWGLQFLLACRRSRADRTTQALLALAELSRRELAAACDADGLEFEHRVAGKLVVYDSEAGLAGARRQVELQRRFGSQQEVLPARACLEREPALHFIAERIVGGVWTPTEAVGDSRALTRELIDRAVRYGAELRFGTAVTGVEIDRGATRIRALVTPRGADAVDQVVIANGSGAARLGRLLGLRLPVYPIKGYSVTLPLRDPGRAPTVSVTDAGRKTVYAPLPGRLRVAGFAELVGDDLSIDARRINQLLDAAAATFPGAFDRAGEHAAWAGLRPATPTSLPLIGATRWSNVWLNVGHGTLGFTLAMGSAQTLKQLLVKRTANPSILPQPAPAA